MKKIRVSTPGKLMLFGEHSVVYNRPCIVAAVDQRFVVEVERIKEREMIVQAAGVGIYDYRKKLDDLGETRITKELSFVEVVVREFYKKHPNGGIRIETKNHFSSEHGFGSSAAVTVGLSKALHEMCGIKMSNKQLFNFCYEVVLKVQGVGSGFDIAAALYGGVLRFVTGGKEIKPLKFGDLPIVVGYSGVKADTPTLVRQVAERKRRNSKKIEKCFDEITEIVKEAEGELLKGNWQKAGELMNENQVRLKELGVSSVELDRLIKASIKAGAYGAKLSGAGGGDCMLAVVDKQNRVAVEKAIEVAGGEVMKVKLGAEGARIEK
jgi:mevalonate kinase